MTQFASPRDRAADPSQTAALTRAHQPDLAALSPHAVKRVVVVDDSATSRSWLCHLIGNDPRLRVVGQACDAQEARSIIKATNPDVVTLDIQMPGMSGLEFLEHLITLRPMPVVMVSSLTKQGSDVAIRALSLGAVDCIVKPTGPLDGPAQRSLTTRLYAAAGSQVKGLARSGGGMGGAGMTGARAERQIILMGASTGGVTALHTVLSGLPRNGAPVVIVQHMPAPFLKSFAQRLDKLLPQKVGLLEPGVTLLRGQVHLAPSLGDHSVVEVTAQGWQTGLVSADSTDLHCPSVDRLFLSALPRAPAVTAVLLTGLGRDGALGMNALRRAGAHTIGQDHATSTVYGMPRAAFELGGVAEQLPLPRIAAAINRHSNAATRTEGE